MCVPSGAYLAEGGYQQQQELPVALTKTEQSPIRAGRSELTLATRIEVSVETRLTPKGYGGELRIFSRHVLNET